MTGARYARHALLTGIARDAQLQIKFAVRRCRGTAPPEPIASCMAIAEAIEHQRLKGRFRTYWSCTPWHNARMARAFARTNRCSAPVPIGK
eukprot:5800087-Lingulodinium_polyedra.AAC.1